MWLNILKYVNKPSHIQYKINKGFHYFKRKKIQYQIKHINSPKNTNKQVNLTHNLKYKERV